ncbi:MAG: polyketide synthase dehydratase domain-containing protein [Candidatus Magnetomorum sp.]|nr:polyketide synthase dehydratase domain-containing protein [Candidatus Magnetomorum sp.]
MQTKDLTTLLKRSLHTIETLKAKLNDQRTIEPIAIIGMACRFPGGSNTPEKFWSFLENGKDGVIPVPEDRWHQKDFYDPNPEAPDKMYVNEAGFLTEDISDFDARLFNISPREASEIDPQQRLLLETTWEAIERCGIDPKSLKKSQTGVFVGIISSEYITLPRASISAYSMTGSTLHMASGRISHILGLQGPAISLDTACSSALTAIHLACEGIWGKTCQTAIAGGTNLMLTPYPFISLSKIQALAKDGRCKSFDASGDGYGRGEGCGMVVLKKLSDAQKNNDPILAVILSSVINHDGPSSGLTVPNRFAQSQIYQDALRLADKKANDISYIESHGTGTSLGDPIEIQSITDIYSKDRNEDTPLIIGSVKANIGHLEAAAGISALIKTVLCLQHKCIPPQIHLNNLNPRIHLSKIPAIIPISKHQWNTNGKPRIAAISSFGFSGTNAHLIVSEYNGSVPNNTTQKLTTFNPKKYWIKSPPEKILEEPPQIQLKSAPFDCQEMSVPFNPADYFVYTISFQNLPDLKDVHGIIHVGYFYLMLFKAIEKRYGTKKFFIIEMNFQTALLIPKEKDTHIYIVIKNNGSNIGFQFVTCVDKPKKSWLTHVAGSLVLNQEIDNKTVMPNIQSIKQKNTPYLGADFYECMDNNDVRLGASVQWIERLWIGKTDVLAKFRLPLKNEKKYLDPLNVHPGIIDACAQLFNAFALMGSMDNKDMTYIVVQWSHCYFQIPDTSEELWGYLKVDMSFEQKDMLSGHLLLLEDTGKIISKTQCEMKGLSKALKQKMAEMNEANDRKTARHLNENILNILKNNIMPHKKEILTHYLCEILSPLLEMEISEIDAETPIRSLGMDSLMGLTFKQTIENTLPVELPVEILIEGPCLGEIAETLLQLIPDITCTNQTNYPKNQSKNYLMDPQKWLPKYQADSSAKVRLLCFAHGMAGASLFNDWSKQMPPEIEVCPIQLPGKEERLQEDAIDSIPEVVDALVQILSPLMDRPYALFGNSYGSLIAFRLARQLNVSLPNNKPLHLFASAYTSPTIYPNPALKMNKKLFQSMGFKHIPSFHLLSSDNIDTLIEKMMNEETQLSDEFMKQFQFNDSEYKKYMKTMLPSGIADLRMVDKYVHDTNELTIDFPMTIFHGKNDPYNSIKEMESWKELTTGKFTIKVFDAGHLFIKEKQQQMIDIISHQLNIKGGRMVQEDTLNTFKVIWNNAEDEQLFWYRPTLHHYMQTKPLDFDLNVRIIREATSENYYKTFDSPMKGICRYFNTYCYASMSIRPDIPFEKIPEYNNRFSEQVFSAIETCVEDWHSKWLPEIKTHLAYWESFDLEKADNNNLLNHLNETIKRFTRLWEIHHIWGTPVFVAVGLFEEMYLDLFKDADQLEPYELLTGFDNEIVEGGRMLWQLSQNLLKMPDILSVFQQNDVQTILTQIQKLPHDHEFIRQWNAYLKKYGIMADVVMLEQPFWSEKPESVIRIIQNNLNQTKKDALNQSEMTQKRLQKQKQVKEKLKGYPKPIVQKFESLLEKAQACNQLLEGHTFWLDYPATFYTRQAILESARRLVQAKTLVKEQDVFYLYKNELLHALEKLPEPVDFKKEINERKALESNFSTISPPPFIGTPPTTPPPDDAIFRIFMKFEPPPQLSEKSDEIKGYAGSPGVVTGTARIARTFEEADRIKPGEILVAISTVCSWTPLFSSVSAVVTDNGGILSHGAIVAREYGIPAVVGTGVATHMIQDGQHIEVNGNTGTVRILS